MNSLIDPKKHGTHGASNTYPIAGSQSVDHYLLLLFHRKWLVLLIFLTLSAGTVVYTHYLPDLYTSETLVLVDPQQVPESYVRATVTGDVRNRLGALSQQILSATRLRTIIDRFNLYQEEKKTKPAESIINLMRENISVNVVSGFGSGGMQAFKISYSALEPRVVAQVTNELASLFIEENLKARERAVTGTTDFMGNQLEETRKKLEVQESQLRDFKLKHLGEMPNQLAANLQILGQLQNRLQGINDALNRAEQQKSYIHTLLASSQIAARPQNKEEISEPFPESLEPEPSPEELQLTVLLTRYGEMHPDVQRLKRQIQEQQQVQEQKKLQELAEAQSRLSRNPEEAVPAAPANSPFAAAQAQLRTVEEEAARHKAEQQRIEKRVATYQARVEAAPLREQQLIDLSRDYGISKEYYHQLLQKKLSAETALQLEIRQKGERFSILDPAQVPSKPSWPNRLKFNAAGSLAALAFGLVIALRTEVLGITITSPEQIMPATGLPVLGIVSTLCTRADRRRRKWVVVGAVSGVVTLLLAGLFLLNHFGVVNILERLYVQGIL